MPKSPPAAGVAEALAVAAGVVDAPPNREPAGLLVFPNKLVVAPPLELAPPAPKRPPDGAGVEVPLAGWFPNRPPVVVAGCENKPPVAGCVVAGVVVPNEKLGVPVVVEADPKSPPVAGAVAGFAGLDAPLELAPPVLPNVNDIAEGYVQAIRRRIGVPLRVVARDARA